MLPLPLHQVSRVLNHDEILRLPSTPITLVPLDPASRLLRVILPILCAYTAHVVTDVEDMGGSDYFSIGTGNDDQELFGPVSAVDLLRPTDLGIDPRLLVQGGNFLTNGLTLGSYNSVLARHVNKAITLSLSSNGTDYTGGDPLNTLTVSFAFAQVNVLTGEFF